MTHSSSSFSDDLLPLRSASPSPEFTTTASCNSTISISGFILLLLVPFTRAPISSLPFDSEIHCLLHLCPRPEAVVSRSVKLQNHADVFLQSPPPLVQIRSSPPNFSAPFAKNRSISASRRSPPASSVRASPMLSHAGSSTPESSSDNHAGNRIQRDSDL